MSNYRKSQSAIDEAEAALLEGDEARARACYHQAALLQQSFLDGLPPDRVRTKSIYGLSTATLFQRAGEIEDAERLAHQLLAAPWIEARSAEGLRALLDRIWKERRRAATSAPRLATNKEASRVGDPPQRRARILPTMSKGRRLDNRAGCPA